MAASTLTSKGQVTIPKEIRELLGVREGDRLLFRLDDRGNVVLQPEAKDPLGRLPGLLRHLAGARPVSVEEMDEAIRRRTRRKFARERG
jgi:AbrB family looped-hinge helix DNA binding protein